jgi:hypothetical protein
MSHHDDDTFGGERFPDTLPSPVATPYRPKASLRLRTDVPGRMRRDVDEVVLAAWRGDRLAITAIRVAFGPNLVALAQGEIERTTPQHERQVAAYVLDELFECMAQGVLDVEPPRVGEGLAWLESLVRTTARVWEFPSEASYSLFE